MKYLKAEVLRILIDGILKSWDNHPGNPTNPLNPGIKRILICAVVAAGMLSCGQDADQYNQEDAKVAAAAAADEAAIDTMKVTEIFPGMDFLSKPAAIDAWVRFVHSRQDQFEQKGPYTIVRVGGNYETTAYLFGGEIVHVYYVMPGGLSQRWVYLHHYEMPTMRELGRDGKGRYFERRFYYEPGNRLLAARERWANSGDELPAKPWRQYRPESEKDIRVQPEAMRQDVLKLIAGK